MTKKMKDKLKFYTAITTICLVALFSFGGFVGFVAFAANGFTITVQSANMYFGGGEMIDVGFGGDTNLDNLVLDGDLTVGDDATIGDDTTFTDDVTIGGDADIAGGLGFDADAGSVTDASSSLTVALTLTAAQVCDSNIITVTHGALTGAGINVTLPATSTLFADCMDDNGDHVTFIYANQSTLVGSTTTIVAGSGIDLLSDDANGDIIAGGGKAIVTLWRVGISDDATKSVFGTISPYTAAD